MPGLGKLQPPACIERSRSLLRRVDCGRTAKPDKAEAEGAGPVGNSLPSVPVSRRRLMARVCDAEGLSYTVAFNLKPRASLQTSPKPYRVFSSTSTRTFHVKRTNSSRVATNHPGGDDSSRRDRKPR